MTVIGITGPTGSGKGIVSEIIFNRFGFPVIDADKVYHALVSSPSNCLYEIKEHFGEDVIDLDGALDRHKLGALVFGEENKERLQLLNEITHKYVIEEIRKKLTYFRETQAACIIDAPLLIESGLDAECDFTISIIADQTIRAKRIAMRDNITLSDAQKRIRSQKSDDFYVTNTDYSLINDSDIDDITSSILKILSERRVI